MTTPKKPTVHFATILCVAATLAIIVLGEISTGSASSTTEGRDFGRVQRQALKDWFERSFSAVSAALRETTVARLDETTDHVIDSVSRATATQDPAPPPAQREQIPDAPVREAEVESDDDPPQVSEYEEAYGSQRKPPRFERIDGLFLDLTAGALNEPGKRATAMGSVGFNYGVPLVPDLGLGLQIGGDATIEEGGEHALDGTTGLFLRGLDIGDELQLGGAFLGDYRHTIDDADLFSLRGIVGISTGAGVHIGARAVYPLNNDTIERTAGTKTTEEITTRHDVFVGQEFSSDFGAEISVGYQADDVDAMIFGLNVSWALDPFLSVAPMAEMNTDGDYSVGLSLIYDFGGTQRSSTLSRFGRRSADDYTPFRKRSFPLMMIHRERKRFAGPDADVDPIPGKPCDCFKDQGQPYDDLFRRKKPFR